MSVPCVLACVQSVFPRKTCPSIRRRTRKRESKVTLDFLAEFWQYRVLNFGLGTTELNLGTTGCQWKTGSL